MMIIYKNPNPNQINKILAKEILNSERYLAMADNCNYSLNEIIERGIEHKQV